MRHTMSEEELIQGFDEALKMHYIVPYYQAQYNHSTGHLVGAEALMRWIDPEAGIQSPANFIPVFEKADLITRADLYIFEEVCRFERKCLDEGIALVPVSFNLSRLDILKDYCISSMEEIRKRYDIPVKYIRVEITESIALSGMEKMMDTIEKLHSLGYRVEMDDFGSGYSSLNMLKDLDVDVLKLDMKFFSGAKNGREGIIISSVVHMSKWLETPVIAEGVEKTDQADYLRSIGCNYIQGYLYAKPEPEEAFTSRLKNAVAEMREEEKVIEGIDNRNFWDPESSGTLLFNNFMGPTAFFSYQNGTVEILKVNKKYVEELGMNLSEYDLLHSDPWLCQSEESKRTYTDAIERAMKNHSEEHVTTWRVMTSRCCGEDRVCIESWIQPVGQNGMQTLFFARIHNITKEINRFNAVADSERKFRFASEQINVYAWEYTISTHEMRPCFRCMRDLGLPPLLKNYPDSAIEMGIFPPDYADMYRNWHHQLENGVEHLEAIIPLTVGRIPFHVRYTLERDEAGRPLKAYGSAALVVDGEEKK